MPKQRYILVLASKKWTPKKALSGNFPILWLKADSISGSDGDAVTTWTDQGPNGNHVTQAAAGAKPTYKINIVNGKPVLRFDGGDYLRGAFTGALSQPYTTLIVAQLGTGLANDGNTYQYFDSDDNTNRMSFNKASGPTPDANAVFAGAVLTSTLAADENWHIHTIDWNSTSTLYLRDNATAASGDAGTHNADGITVGADRLPASNFVGDIAEILIYDPALSASDRGTVQRYLAFKYNITLF